MATDGFIGNSTPNIAANQNAPVMNFSGNIILQGVTTTVDSKAYYESPDGRRQVIKIVREDISNNDSNSDGIVRDINKAQR